VACRVEVDRSDHAVSVWWAQEDCMTFARQMAVLDVAAAPSQKPRILLNAAPAGRSRIRPSCSLILRSFAKAVCGMHEGAAIEGFRPMRTEEPGTPDRRYEGVSPPDQGQAKR
jgi:hypothetical protein